MKVECSHCQGIVEVDDADVFQYAKQRDKSPARAAANAINAKKPRPGSIGNTRARKKVLTE